MAIKIKVAVIWGIGDKGPLGGILTGEGKRRDMKIAGMVPHSLVDGPGVRFVVFFQGCPHRCPGCHNRETWDQEGGTETGIGEVVDAIRNTRYLDGVTFSGGEPLLQAGDCIEIIEALRGEQLTFWCYTGWTVEEILAGRAGLEAVKLMRYLDIVVDGPFDAEKAENPPVWRGSSNQRLVDARESLRMGRAVIEPDFCPWD